MGKIELRKYPSAILRKPSDIIGPIGRMERELLDKMIEAMYENKGIGLAAPQIGVSLRMAVIDIGKGPIKFINPKILKKEGSEIFEEGCLSVPGAAVNVKRAKKILIKYIDEEGVPKNLEAEGLFARAIQHEIDHLNGRLIIDYLNPIKRFFLRRRMS